MSAFEPPNYARVIAHQFEAIRVAIIAGDDTAEKAGFAGLGQLVATMSEEERWEVARAMGEGYKVLHAAYVYALASSRNADGDEQREFIQHRLAVAQEHAANLDRETAPTDRSEEILALAMKIGQHWRDQQGVNAALLDQLAELTKPPGKEGDAW